LVEQKGLAYHQLKKQSLADSLLQIARESHLPSFLERDEQNVLADSLVHRFEHEWHQQVAQLLNLYRISLTYFAIQTSSNKTNYEGQHA
jgi:hypothetical protein